MTANGIETEQLLDRVVAGDARARQRLLDRHRDRLRRMVAVRLDRRAGRPGRPLRRRAGGPGRGRPAGSTTTSATGPLPFYPWLRQFAWERLVQLHRHHLRAERSVARERGPAELPDGSVGRRPGRAAGPPAPAPAADLIRAEDSRPRPGRLAPAGPARPRGAGAAATWSR